MRIFILFKTFLDSITRWKDLVFKRDDNFYFVHKEYRVAWVEV